MSNSFNSENQILLVLKDLSTNQKMSIINLLLTIAVCDSDQGDRLKESNYLNLYTNSLNLRSDSCMAYFESDGHEKMIEDLKLLNANQKVFLIVAAYEMITSDGPPNETELHVTAKLFEKIGIEWKEFLETIKKAQKFSNYFSS